MPFSTIKNQIDSNYSEIQEKTTRAVIARLGLGMGKIEMKPVYSQTVDNYVEQKLYDDLENKLIDAKIREEENLKEMQKL